MEFDRYDTDVTLLDYEKMISNIKHDIDTKLRNHEITENKAQNLKNDIWLCHTSFCVKYLIDLYGKNYEEFLYYKVHDKKKMF